MSAGGGVNAAFSNSQVTMCSPTLLGLVVNTVQTCKMQIFPLKLMKIDIYFFSQNITAVLQYSDLTYFLCFFNGSCNSPVEL